MIPEEFENKIRLYKYLKDLISKERLQKIEDMVPQRTNFIAPVIEDIY